MTSPRAHRVAVVGTGYVGLTTGAALATLGHHVVCADVDTARVAGLRGGRIPIVEQGLEDVVRAESAAGRLRFESDSAASVAGAEVVFLCVPTPSAADGRSDLSYLKAASADIREALEPGTVVVNKSTVPVGSTRVVEEELGRYDVSVVSNPEFLREGTALHDFLHPDRIVIGAASRRAAERVAALYWPIEAPVLLTDPASAETIKYAANAFLATKVSFANAIAALCEAVDADVTDVLEGLGADHRIGHDFLRPGPGWGGSCLPKDTLALVTIAANHGYDFALVRGVIEVNEQQRHRIVSKIRDAAGGSLDGVAVGVLGLTFKANTDDLRDSPSVAVVTELLDAGAKVRAYDPTVSVPVPSPRQAMLGTVAGRSQICDDPLDACSGVEVIALLTEWSEFAELPLDRLADGAAAGATLVDARNLLDPEAVRAAGLSYVGVGRRHQVPR